MMTSHYLPPHEEVRAELLEINAMMSRESRREREKRLAARQYAARCAIEKFREEQQLKRVIGDHWLED